MRRRLGSLLAGTLVLTACNTGVPARPTASAAPRATPSAKPSTAASAGPTMAPADVKAAMATVQKLTPPPAGSTAIKGQLQLDKAYMLAQGGGRALQVGGVAALAANGGALVGNDGASVIANAANQIVVSGAGNVVAPPDAKLIGNDGSTLIGNDGSTLIGNDGSTLIGMDGSTLIGNDGSTYRLAQAATALDRLPVAGALVGAIDLRTGQPVPIGKVAGDKDVFLAYTDAAGRFELFLPPDVAKNVLIVTSAASAGKADARLSLGVIAAEAQRGDVKIDEASALVTGYLRTCLTIRLRESMATGDASNGLADGDFAKIALADLFAKLNEVGASEGFTALGPLAGFRAVQASVDALLANVDLAGVKVNTYFPGPHGAEDDALAALREDAAAIEQAVALKVQADPTFYQTSDVVRAANLMRPADRPWILQRPSDFTDMMVQAFMSTARGQSFDMVGVAAIELGASASLEDGFQQAGLSIFSWLGLETSTDDRMQAMVEALRAAIKREKAAARPEPAAGKPPQAPQDPPMKARKLATLPPLPADKGYREEATRMAVVPAADGGVWVADGLGGKVYHVTKDGAAAALGNGADYPFGLPAGLAVGAKGELYVCDTRLATIFQIDDPLGTPQLHPIAGAINKDGPEVDGPIAGVDARFSDPEGIAIGPDGALYVADAHNHRVRRVDLAGPAHMVTIYAGGKADGDKADSKYLDADTGELARLERPRGLAFGKKGLYVTASGRLRLILPPKDGRYEVSSGPVTTVGGGYWNDTTGDRPAYLTRLESLAGVAVGADERLFFAEAVGRLRDRRPDGWITTIATEAGGPAWQRPLGVGAGAGGTVLVGDAKTREVWELTP